VPRVDCHDGLSSGDGPRGHEAPHHVVVLELVPDGVCMVWAGLLEEPLEVVCERPRLTLVAPCESRDARLSTALDALPAIVDGNV
jgi:hypothetical protein